eukprot:TRINITY_DN51273_c0_g1_i1.p1 TRINITY_DN51273_c0_g1~~TRINITY_DN51273_c0_g1_i1.p1  ORF type:complete len:105 (+),score=5.21 TRINITY_DN51273_c0_g1_i1:40-315(+)
MCIRDRPKPHLRDILPSTTTMPWCLDIVLFIHETMFLPRQKIVLCPSLGNRMCILSSLCDFQRSQTQNSKILQRRPAIRRIPLLSRIVQSG